MSLYLTAPTYHTAGDIINPDDSIFLAGSISNAADWQTKVALCLRWDTDLNVINPRREIYDGNEEEQITWEFFYLRFCNIIMFYFSHETLAPITLFEYGKMLERLKHDPYKKLYICIHPDYKRKQDVIIQTELENPELANGICFDLGEVTERIITDFPKKD